MAMALLLKCLFGAAAVLLIALASRSRNFYLAGLVPLFPTFALIAHYIVGTERSAADLRTTALFGLLSIIPYAIYLLVVYFLSTRTGLAATLALATVAWCVGAAMLIVVWSKTVGDRGGPGPDKAAVVSARPPSDVPGTPPGRRGGAGSPRE